MGTAVPGRRRHPKNAAANPEGELAPTSIAAAALDGAADCPASASIEAMAGQVPMVQRRRRFRCATTWCSAGAASTWRADSESAGAHQAASSPAGVHAAQRVRKPASTSVPPVSRSRGQPSARGGGRRVGRSTPRGVRTGPGLVGHRAGPDGRVADGAVGFVAASPAAAVTRAADPGRRRRRRGGRNGRRWRAARAPDKGCRYPSL